MKTFYNDYKFNSAMKNLCIFGLLFLLAGGRPAAQVLFYEAAFNGGVTGGGYSPDYSTGGTRNFSVFIQPRSSIYKAYLIARRHGQSASLSLTPNRNPFTFDNSNQGLATF